MVHDFLPRICGAAAVNNAIATVSVPPGSPFRMPVEFAVAAYRFGHSMIRDRYLLNSSLPVTISSLDNVFAFVRVPRLPVLSNWVVDFNLFFHTAHPIPGSFNNARKIDSVLANGLERIPGGSGILSILAARNLRRGMAMELPSGQGAAAALGIPPLTAAQLTAGLSAAEVALLNSNGGILLSRTPLWYYVLREAVVLNGGDQLGPVGGRIVAETFVRMLQAGRQFIHEHLGLHPVSAELRAGDIHDRGPAGIRGRAGAVGRVTTVRARHLHDSEPPERRVRPGGGMSAGRSSAQPAARPPP